MAGKKRTTDEFDEPSTGPLTFVKQVTSREWQFAGAGAIAMLLLLLLLSVFGIFSLPTNGNNSSTNSDGTVITSEAQSGLVALTEAELRAEVKKISIPVYWAGPLEGALYTLENQANLRVFVRYLPDGKIPSEGEATKRIIGTYVLRDAFQSTKTAGTTVAGGIGFENDDGAAVYYNSSAPNNVYIAYPGVDAQIEIFDPEQGVAVQLATARGTIQAIR